MDLTMIAIEWTVLLLGVPLVFKGLWLAYLAINDILAALRGGVTFNEARRRREQKETDDVEAARRIGAEYARHHPGHKPNRE